MKNMPSVMKEIPIAAARSVTGKWTQPERMSPVVGGGVDSLSFAANADSPETFQRMLQKNLQGRDQGRVHGASPGGDRQIQDQDITNPQMIRMGMDGKLHEPAGEEPLPNRKLSILAPEIRGTAKKKISKGQYSVGATNFIISSANIAPVNEYRDPSSEASVDSQRRLDGHRGAGEELKITTVGVASSPLKTDFGKRALQTAIRERLSSRGGQRDASGKAEEPGRFGNGHDDRQATSAERGIGISGGMVTDGTGASANSVPPDALGDSMLAALSGKSRPDKGGGGVATGAAPSPFNGEHAQGMAAAEQALTPPTTLGAQSVDTASIALASDAAEEILSLGGGPVRRDHGHFGNEGASTETGARTGGSAAVETEGSGNADTTGLSGNLMPIVRGTEFGQDDGSKEAAGVSLSPLKARSGGRAHQPKTGEKGALLPNAFAFQAVGTEPGKAGPDAADKSLSREGREEAFGETAVPIRFRHRPGGKETALAEKGGSSDGRVASVETKGGGKTETTGTFSDSTRADRGEESQQDNGDSGAASGIASSSPRAGLAERVHLPMTGDGEQTVPQSSTFAAAVVDTIAPGLDTGEGASSAGRSVLMAQVIEAAQPLVQHGGGRILISLNPPSLGALDIDVRVKRENVELFVIANNQDVQQTLCSHVEQLRKALIDQGLNMDRFQVVVGDRSGSQQGRDPRQEGTPGWQGGSQGDRGYHPETDGSNASEEIGWAVQPDVYPSVGGINVFI